MIREHEIYKYYIQQLSIVLLILLIILPIEKAYASLFFINTKDEIQEGYKQNAAFTKINNQEMLSRIQKIGDKLAENSRKRNGMDYIFSIIKDENAFSGFAGFIYVGQPLYNLVSTDDELAFIIAHEMAHSDNRDTADSIEQIYAEKYKSEEDTKVSISDAMLKGYFFNRIQEYRADSQAVLYLYLAGYDPEAGLRVMNKFQQKFGPYPPGTEEVAGHPSYTNRKRNIEAFIKEMKYVENFYIRDGDKFMAQQNYFDAIKSYTEYLGFFYNSSLAYSKRGYAYYLKAVGQNSNSKYAWSDGRNPKEIKTKSGNLDTVNLYNALKDFQKAGTIDTTNSELYNFMGLISAQLGEYNVALDYLKKAIELKPDNCSAKNNLAVLYALQSKYNNAKELLNNISKVCVDQQNIDYNMTQIINN